MFATLLGYVALLAFQRMALPLLSGSFGPREHNIIQTVATSTGGMSVMFFGAVPAMYQLGLLHNPREDFGKLAALTGSAAFFGSAMSVPMRRIFILQFGRELDLVFPSAAAIATAIRQLHLGAKNPELKSSTYALVSSFSISTAWTIGASYARGILWDWNITWYIYQWGGHANRAIYAVNWGFFTIEWTPALIGIGMLIPLNVGVSWLLGYCVSYGIIGPILVAKGLAVGVAYHPKYPDLVMYKALHSEDLISAPSPRYWLLFPAILVTICATFTDVLVHYKMFWNVVRVGGSRMAGSLQDRPFGMVVRGRLACGKGNEIQDDGTPTGSFPDPRARQDVGVVGPQHCRLDHFIGHHDSALCELSSAIYIRDRPSEGR